MRFKGVIFSIDNVLYDTKFQKDSARISAIRAMIEAGLPVQVEDGFRVLNDIIAEHGPDYQWHFDKMLERLGISKKARVIAAGVEAYSETSRAYLQPYPDTIPTIVRLRDVGCKIGAISSGNPVKQWQKLIKLGVQHLFHHVLISEEIDEITVNKKVFQQLIQGLNTSAKETLFVGNEAHEEFQVANDLGLTTVRIRRGAARIEEPRSTAAQPRHVISCLSDLLKIIEG
ncbi:MAG: HAD family hydrolase [Candidatus Bathyarchaeia archaeon]